MEEDQFSDNKGTKGPLLGGIHGDGYYYYAEIDDPTKKELGQKFSATMKEIELKTKPVYVEPGLVLPRGFTFGDLDNCCTGLREIYVLLDTQIQGKTKMYLSEKYTPRWEFLVGTHKDGRREGCGFRVGSWEKTGTSHSFDRQFWDRSFGNVYLPTVAFNLFKKYRIESESDIKNSELIRIPPISGKNSKLLEQDEVYQYLSENDKGPMVYITPEKYSPCQLMEALHSRRMTETMYSELLKKPQPIPYK